MSRYTLFCHKHKKDIWWIDHIHEDGFKDEECETCTYHKCLQSDNNPSLYVNKE